MTGRPNVIWICLDQFPQVNRAGAQGRSPFWRGLETEFALFKQAYTVLPICSPARASMLTGLYPHVHGLTENDGRFGGCTGLSPDDWMLHQPYADAGYRTALFGKWHLDNELGAEHYGFEGFSLPGYGYPYSTSEYREYLDRYGLAEPVAVVELAGECGVSSGTRINLSEIDNWPEFEAGTLSLHGSASLHEAFFVIDLAAEWLKNTNGQAFFACVNTWGPHPPYCVAPPFTDSFNSDTDWRSPSFFSDLSHRPSHHRSYRDEWRALNYTDLDWRLLTRRSMEQTALVESAVRKLLTTLDASGLSNNTFVVITADHGDAVGSSGGVANKGGLMTEETVRIPMMIRGPGVVPGERSGLVTNVDIAPTLLELAGFDSVSRLQGRNFAHAITAISPIKRHGVMLEHYGLHQRVVQRAWLSDRWKLVVQQDGFEELYDLKHDPAELNNLATNAELHDTRQTLRRALANEMEILADPERADFQTRM